MKIKVSLEKSKEYGYNGNLNILKHNFKYPYSEAELREYLKCKSDISYFIREYCKIIHVDDGLIPFDLYPYQEKMITQFEEERFNIVLSTRQSGKCVHADTIVKFKFLDSEELDVKISVVHDLFDKINNLHEQLFDRKRLCNKEQIFEYLQFNNRETKRIFSRLWGSASCDSRELWWKKFCGQSGESITEGTLSSSYALTEVHKEGVEKLQQGAECLLYDESYSRQYTNKTFGSIRKISKRILPIFEQAIHWRRKSFLWKNVGRTSSKRNVRENSYRRDKGKNRKILQREIKRSDNKEKTKREYEKGFSRSRNPRENIRSIERNVGVRRVSERTIRKTQRRVGRSRVSCKNDKKTSRSKFVRGISAAYVRCNERPNFIRNSRREDFFGSEGQTEIRRAQEENERSAEEYSKRSMPTLSENWQEGVSDAAVAFSKLQGDKKFIESFQGFGFSVKTDTGYVEVIESHKTIEFDEWIVETENHNIIVADDHKFFTGEYSEIFTKNLDVGTEIFTESGLEKVKIVRKTTRKSNMYDLGVSHENHRYYTNGILSHNTTALVGYLTHKALFNPETPIAILAHKGEGAREVLERILLAIENLPYFLQPGCKVLNKGSIIWSNNSKFIAASTSSNSIRGKSQKIVYLDEFAFVQRADEFWAGTYPTISSGKTTQVVITSTLNGPCNLFYNIWEGALQGTNDFKPIRVDWWDVPGRDEAWAEQTRRNIGEVRWQQEFENKVIGATNSLIAPNALMKLNKCEPLQTTNNDVNIYEGPEPEAQYMMMVDVAKGRGQDYSTFNIIKLGEGHFTQVATYRNNLISPLLFPDIIVKYATLYNECLILIESNDAGQVVCNGVYHELEYENMYVESAVKRSGLGITMTKKVKRIGCSNLKDLIELDKLKIRDKETILELSNFVEKGSSYAADGDGHDDLVLNLVLFAYFTNLEIFEEYTDNTLKSLMKAERDKIIEEDVPLFGIIDDGINVCGDVPMNEAFRL